MLCPQTAIAHSHSKNERNDQLSHHQTNMDLHPNLAFRNNSFVLLHSNKSKFVNSQKRVSYPIKSIQTFQGFYCALSLGLTKYILLVFTGFCERVIVVLFHCDPELSILANLTIRQSSVLT